MEKLDVKFDRQRIENEILILMSDLDFLRGQDTNEFLLVCQPDAKAPGHDGLLVPTGLTSYELLQWRKSFNTFHPKYRGFYLEDLWRQFPYAAGRMRLLFVQERRCLWKAKNDRPIFHIPTYTNLSSYLVYPDHAEWYSLPAEGHVFKVTNDREFAFLNCGNDWCVHLLFDSLDEY